MMILARTAAHAAPTEARSAEKAAAEHHQPANSARGKGLPTKFKDAFDPQFGGTPASQQRPNYLAQGMQQYPGCQSSMGQMIGMLLQARLMGTSKNQFMNVAELNG